MPTVSIFNASRHQLLFSPRASITAEKYTPFAELLLGVAHQTDTGANVSRSDTRFSSAVCGGARLQVPLRAIAWRL